AARRGARTGAAALPGRLHQQRDRSDRRPSGRHGAPPAGPGARAAAAGARRRRSRLPEREELRNRDRHAALLSLEAEMERFRPYLDLSPDELLARARTASPAEKKLLEQLGGGEKPRTTRGWGPVQMYFRLSAEEKRPLLAGEKLYYSEGPW